MVKGESTHEQFLLLLQRFNTTFNPLPDKKNLDLFQLKEIADDILKYIESEK